MRRLVAKRTMPSQPVASTGIHRRPRALCARALAGEDLEVVELEKVYRQRDAAFVALLNRIRNDSVDDEDMARLNARLDPGFEPADDDFCVSLTTTNRNAGRINETKLASLPGRRLLSRAEVSGDFGREHYPTAAELAFKEGAQVMMLNNDAAGRWVNGSIGAIESVEEEEEEGDMLLVRLRGEDELVEVRAHTWDLVRFALVGGRIVTEPAGHFTQLPFRLAWAVTIHKSQGKTFERIVVDLERGAFFGEGSGLKLQPRDRALRGQADLPLLRRGERIETTTPTNKPSLTAYLPLLRRGERIETKERSMETACEYLTG